MAAIKASMLYNVVCSDESRRISWRVLCEHTEPPRLIIINISYQLSVIY